MIETLARAQSNKSVNTLRDQISSITNIGNSWSRCGAVLAVCFCVRSIYWAEKKVRKKFTTRLDKLKNDIFHRFLGMRVCSVLAIWCECFQAPPLGATHTTVGCITSYTWTRTHANTHPLSLTHPESLCMCRALTHTHTQQAVGGMCRRIAYSTSLLYHIQYTHVLHRRSRQCVRMLRRRIENIQPNLCVPSIGTHCMYIFIQLVSRSRCCRTHPNRKDRTFAVSCWISCIILFAIGITSANETFLSKPNTFLRRRKKNLRVFRLSKQKQSMLHLCRSKP